MLSLLARRFSLSSLLALSLAASPVAAQSPRADVKRFQWNPVVVHVAAEGKLGVEIYMSVHTNDWALSWFDPDSLSAWLPQLRTIQSGGDGSDSTTWLSGRGSGTGLRVIRGTVQGQEAYALQLRANPSTAIVRAWLPVAYLRDLGKSLEKSVSVAKNVARVPTLANAQPVYEEWDVDEPPQPAAEEHLGAALPMYALRGDVAVGFVVDATGHVVPATVTVYDCEDPNLANRWQSAVAQWHFVPATLDGEHVASRYRLVFTYDTGGSFHVGGDRIVPGRP